MRNIRLYYMNDISRRIWYSSGINSALTNKIGFRFHTGQYLLKLYVRDSL